MNKHKRYYLALVFMLIFGNIAYAGYKKLFGTASYYTYKSCVREGTSGVWTASGERFNEMDMTCAMRSYDFNHLWKVCNTDNNKCVVVRNNDFGPNKKLHKKGRIVDLSKGAFQKIANINKGIINVSVEQLN